MHVTMSVSGAASGTVSFKVVVPDTTCNGTGSGYADHAGVPSPNGSNVKFKGSPLLYSISTGKEKPGAYDTSAFKGSSSAIGLDAASQTDPFGVSNNPRDSTTMVLRSDGSGSLTFADWSNADRSRMLSGTITWTCSS